MFCWQWHLSQYSSSRGTVVRCSCAFISSHCHPWSFSQQPCFTVYPLQNDPCGRPGAVFSYGRGDPCGRPGSVFSYGRGDPCGRPGAVSPSPRPLPCTPRAEVVWGYRRTITKVAPIAGQQLARLRRHALRQHILQKGSIRIVPADGRPQRTLLPQSEKPEGAIPGGRLSTARPLRVAFIKVAIVVICLVLLVGFLFTRYGNENMDYMTNAEITGVHYLYTIAPRRSLLIAGWNGTPWEFQDYEQYDHEVLAEDIPGAVVTRNVASIVQLVQSIGAPATYVIFTRSQKVTARMDGLPPGILDRLEAALLASGKFTQIYSNIDAQIFMYIHVPARAVPKKNK